jgi:hypothetical protein
MQPTSVWPTNRQPALDIGNLGVLLCLFALASLIHYTWQYHPPTSGFWWPCWFWRFAVESTYRLWRRGHLRIEYFR